MNTDSLTEKEFEIMAVFWNSKEALSARDVLDLSQNRTWSDRSLHSLFNNLEKKGFIQVDGKRKSVKTNTRLYSVCFSAEEYTTYQLGKVFTIDPKKQKKLSQLMSFLIHYDSNTNDDRFIEEFIEKFKSEIGD